MISKELTHSMAGHNLITSNSHAQRNRTEDTSFLGLLVSDSAIQLNIHGVNKALGCTDPM